MDSACLFAFGRCLLGEADGALYMAFMGTKQRRDLVTNAQVLQEPIWPEDLMSHPQDSSQVLETVNFGTVIAGCQAMGMSNEPSL